MVIKLGSLFDGIGGFPLAGVKFGFVPVWASEIEPWPIKVTEKHFPGIKHLGDITQINGAEIEPVDIVTFGSPCQDLSVAGKREGLAGERSGLFMDAIRIIRQMRDATGGEYPRFAVWENVPGAFSSNKGEDFRAVLEEITEAEIPMPRSGKWATAGMVRTATADIAWRTIDAQHWGVPQRRRRIFLVADFAGQCAGEILFVEQGLRGDIAESREAGQEAAGDVGTGATESSRINSTPEGVSGAVSSKWAKGTGGPAGDECYNLVVEPRSQDGVCRIHEKVVPTLNTAQGGQRQPCVMAFTQNQRDEVRDLGNKSGALQAQPGMKQQTYIIQNATRGKSQNGLGVSQDDVSCTLDSLGNHAICLQGSMIGRADKNGPQGDGVNEEVSFTLNTTDRHAVAFQPGNLSRQAGAEPSTEVFPTLGATTLGDQFPHVACGVDCRNLYENNELSATIQSKSNGGYSLNYQNPVRIGYAVRRLTPLECLRLMGFPDYWLDIEDMSDTQKYKAIGNSVAIPCVDFVMSGIARAIRPEG